MKIKYLPIAALLMVWCFLPVRVFAAEIIGDFSVKVELSENRTARFVEQIEYDFGDEDRHGIFRYIPTSYNRHGANYDYRLKIISVSMDGASVPYSLESGHGEVRVKIGDPDILISGKHIYTLEYETDRAINFFADGSELYWNVTGNGWQVEIERADLELVLPRQTNAAEIKTVCFTGEFGSVETACESVVSDGTVSFSTTRLLGSSEGLTIVVGLPTGLINEPTWQDRLWMLLQDNGILALPVIVFFLMYYLWRKKGRDPELGTVIPLYESPQGMNPITAAAVMEEGSVPERAITATIIDLARRGYLHIKYGEEGQPAGRKKAFTFLKKKNLDEALAAEEKQIFEGIFKRSDERDLKDLVKAKFYLSVEKAKEDVWKNLSAQKIFTARPSVVRGSYLILAFVIGLVGILFGSFLPLLWLALLMCAVIVAIFGWFMPCRTKKGVDWLAEVKGFKWFMSVTEKDRLKFHNAPERTPEVFHTLLPFAIALGVENEWAKQFEGITIQPPEWAEGSSWSTINSVAFVSSLHSMHTQTASSAYHAPSSAGRGGSGFSGGGSGGGGGGGGGGSW